MADRQRAWPALLVAGLLLWAQSAAARLDLAAAHVERLDNGLTVIVLEESAFPVVSVQMLYRVGAKHEPQGSTGLAHFLEHMAFRSTENFPDTEVVSSIYAAGGEWHGYTWLDQTTYFATAPRDELDLLLRIEADRMGRAVIPKADVEAERGAVLAEMHGYENDPNAVLQDNVLYVSFLAHPYRNNTIGWESDVAGISHDDLLSFYRQHYQPGNAVLAVVGDTDRDRVLGMVKQYFGEFRGRPATPEPRTVEPPQQGERRIEVRGPVAQPQFRMVWRAPSVHNADFAAFLVAQELMAGGSGVSFLQNDWGTPARPASPLDRLGADMTTWFPPSRQDYVFALAGSLPDGMGRAGLEAAVMAALGWLADSLEDGEDDAAIASALRLARHNVGRELLFDVQTTEDAAHQLAYFGGMDALDVLNGLPSAVEAVNLSDVRRVMLSWLGGDQRTIGWYLPVDFTDGTEANDVQVARGDMFQTSAAVPPLEANDSASVQATARSVHRLSNGVPVILQRSPLSATAHLKIVAPGAFTADGVPASPNQPVWGVTSLDYRLLPAELGATLESLGPMLGRASASRVVDNQGGANPDERLQQHFADVLGLADAGATGPGALLIVVSGDFDADRVLSALERQLGSLVPAAPVAAMPLNSGTRMEIESSLDRPVAQERLGFVARAPGPDEPAAAAWWMALYILSHGYEGRLGKEAISRRGLVYYIDSSYGTNGRDGWISLDIGVDPGKLEAMQALLRAELGRLIAEPPTQVELDEARSHLLGRYVSAAQGNDELADRLAREWFWYGELLDFETLETRLARVSRADLMAILPAFTSGAIVAVKGQGHTPE